MRPREGGPVRRKISILLAGVGLMLLSSLGRATAAPPPIPFCLPDLDGHCRYCEIRFAPISVYCFYN